MLTSPTPSRKPLLPISLPTSCISWASDLNAPPRPVTAFSALDRPVAVRGPFRDSMRAPSAMPPASPAAAVPTIAGVFAFCATVPTELPAFPTAEPIESPTPVRVPVTPLADCREVDEPDLAPRDLLWLDRVVPEERFVLAERFALGERFALAGRFALDDGRAVRVGALRGELLRGELLPRDGELPLLRRALVRAGELPLLRDAPVERPLDRVFVWAISTHLPRLPAQLHFVLRLYGRVYPAR